MDPDLAAYYGAIQTIVSDPLFRWSRIVQILKFNLGYYDDHLDRYVASMGEHEDPSINQ